MVFWKISRRAFGSIKGRAYKLRDIRGKGSATRAAWADRVKALPDGAREEFECRNDGKLPVDWK